MNTKYEPNSKALILEITEEIDHHEVEKIRRKADDEITRYMPRKVIFDFNSVTFMDSAGIGMVLGRYKMIKMLGGTLEMINVSSKLKKIFELSGVTKIVPIGEVSISEIMDNGTENLSQNVLSQNSKYRTAY